MTTCVSFQLGKIPVCIRSNTAHLWQSAVACERRFPAIRLAGLTDGTGTSTKPSRCPSSPHSDNRCKLTRIGSQLGDEMKLPRCRFLHLTACAAALPLVF